MPRLLVLPPAAVARQTESEVDEMTRKEQRTPALAYAFISAFDVLLRGIIYGIVAKGFLGPDDPSLGSDIALLGCFVGVGMCAATRWLLHHLVDWEGALDSATPQAESEVVVGLREEVERLRSRQRDGNDWAVATFGPATVESTMRRIDQELAEFYDDPVNEAKDIVIFLYRLVSVAGRDLDAEVDAKMEVNRKRTWVLNGEGCGQHTGSTAREGLMEGRRRLESQLTACQQQLERAREALTGMLPLAQKLFNNTVTAAHERGTPLEPVGVAFEDLKFVQKSRAVLADTADSSPALPAGSTPQAEKKGSQ